MCLWRGRALKVADKQAQKSAKRGWRSAAVNLYPIFVVAYLSASVAIFAADPFFVKALRLIAFDSYQRLAPLPEKDFGVRIVDIDERSLALIGQFPWPRTKFADMLDQLRANGA